MDILSEMIQNLHYNLGITHLIQFLVSNYLIVGILIGGLLMFLYDSFIDTLIERTELFPGGGAFITHHYDQPKDGKRITTAPPIIESIKDAIAIRLSAILWSLYLKKQPYQYKSDKRNRIAFYTLTGLAMVLTLMSYVSTSDAFVEGIKHNPHYIALAKQHARKTQPPQQKYQLTDRTVQESTQSVSASAPEKTNGVTPKLASPAPEKQDNSQQAPQPNHSAVKQHVHVTNTHQAAKSQIKISENKQDKNKVPRVRAQGLIKRVEVDGHPVVETDDEEKVAGVVKDAVRNGAKEIRITVQSLPIVGRVLDQGQDNNNQ